MAHILIGIMISFAAFCRVILRGKLDLLDWTLFAVAGVYCWGTAYVLWATSSGLNTALWERHIAPTDMATIAGHGVATILMTIGILYGWSGTAIFRLRKVKRANLYTITRALWILLAAAIAVQVLYSAAFGGLIAALDHAREVRSGLSTISNKWSFLRPLAGVVFLSSIGFWGLILSRRSSWFTIAGFILSLCFSFYLMLAWAGRLNALVILSVFPLSYLLNRVRSPLTSMALAGSALLLLLVFTHILSGFLQIKASDNALAFAAKEMSFPLANFFAWSGANVDYRVFSDIVAFPLFLLPQSVWQGYLVGVVDINTELITGTAKGVDGNTNGIPIDLISLGIAQLGITGVLIVGVVHGAIIGGFQSAINRMPTSGLYHAFGVYVGIRIAALGLFYTNPESFFKNHLATIIAIAVILLAAKRKPGSSHIHRTRFGQVEPQVSLDRTGSRHRSA